MPQNDILTQSPRGEGRIHRRRIEPLNNQLPSNLSYFGQETNDGRSDEDDPKRSEEANFHSHRSDSVVERLSSRPRL
jgi:hypothetical protein